MLLVSLPIAGLTGSAIVAASMTPTAAETAKSSLGKTQAAVRVVNPPDPSLRQSPDDWTTWTVDVDDNGDPTDASGRASVTPQSLFDKGTTLIELFPTAITAESKTGVAGFDVVEGESWNPALTGHFDLVEGRRPAAGNEVVVTASALGRLGAGVGDSIVVQQPAPTAITIVGILDDSTVPDSREIIFANTGTFSTERGAKRVPASTYYLPDTELNSDAVDDLNAQGAIVLSRDVLLAPATAASADSSTDGDRTDETLAAAIVLLGIFLAFEVTLLAGAAFTITAREQLATLAVVASVGATRSTLTRIVTSIGTTLGLVGGLVGLVLGTAAAAIFTRVTADGSSVQYPGFHMPGLALAALVVFAVLIGWSASRFPARNAARLDVVEALRGTRRPPVSTRRRPVIGVVLALGGVALSLVGGVLFSFTIEKPPLSFVPIAFMVFGPILAQIGFIRSGPLLLRVAGALSSGLGVSARLAGRDTARNPARAVPAVAAIMSAVFLAVTAMALIGSVQRVAERDYTYLSLPGQVRVELTYIDRRHDDRVVDYPNREGIADAVSTIFDVPAARTLSSVAASDEDDFAMRPRLADSALCPDARRSIDHSSYLRLDDDGRDDIRRTDPRCTNSLLPGHSSSPATWVGDADDLAVILGRPASKDAVATLAEGGAVAFYPGFVENGRITLEWWTEEQDENAEWETGEPSTMTKSLEAVLQETAVPIPFGVFVSTETADSLGLDYAPTLLLGTPDQAPTLDQQDSLAKALLGRTGFRGTEDDGLFARLEAGPPEFETQWSWGLLAASAAIAIGAAAVAIGLARFDGRRDRGILASLGASRGIARRFAFWQAVVLTGIGSVLGAALGLVPALSLSATHLFPFAPPLAPIAVGALLLPLAIGCFAWLTARDRSHFAGRS